MRRLIVAFSAAMVLCGLWFHFSLQPADTKSAGAVSVSIKSGDSLQKIAEELERSALIRSSFAFKLYARITGSSRRLQAGTFRLNSAMSVSHIIEILSSGKSEEILVTIPEGFTVADIDALLAKKGLGNAGDIIDCAFRCDFSNFDFLPAKHPGTVEEGIGSRLEGYLFPETYAVSRTEYHPKFFLERMLGTFRSRVIRSHSGAVKNSGRTLHDLVIMASLIEAESRHEEERAVVSGILWKRLEYGILLGVDATTRYALKKPKEVLLKTDVDARIPYNTRVMKGLPPGPIENPGESSFLASLNPVQSQYWYYLHGNDGVIRYAVTNDEHNRNRARYLR